MGNGRVRTAALALPYAVEFAARDAATLAVVHIHEIFVGYGGAYPVVVDEGELREQIAQQVEDLRDDGLDATFTVRSCQGGHAARAIAEIATEIGADLILVGTHGYGRVASALVGSVTMSLLHGGVCPVLAVPAGNTVAAPKLQLVGGAVG